MPTHIYLHYDSYDAVYIAVWTATTKKIEAFCCNSNTAWLRIYCTYVSADNSLRPMSLKIKIQIRRIFFLFSKRVDSINEIYIFFPSISLTPNVSDTNMHITLQKKKSLVCFRPTYIRGCMARKIETFSTFTLLKVIKWKKVH